jgi:hypothetical protein
VPNKDGTLKAREFVFFCEDQVLTGWPKDIPEPTRKVMWTTLQFHWGEKRVHFELQPMMGRRLIEVGLHFEGPEAMNEAWAIALGGRADELIPELGLEWDLEDWTKSWRRLHRPYHFEKLTADLGREIAGELRRGMQILDPVIAERLDTEESVPVEAPQGPKSRRNWRRRARASR